MVENNPYKTLILIKHLSQDAYLKNEFLHWIWSFFFFKKTHYLVTMDITMINGDL